MSFSRVMSALLMGLRDFFHPRILLLSLVAFFLGIGVWIAFLSWIGVALLGWMTQTTGWDMTGGFGMALLIFLSFPLVLIVGLVLLSILAFPWVRRFLRSRGYQERQTTGSISLSSQIFEIVIVASVGVMGWVFFLFWFWVPIVPAVLAILLLGWVQWRLLSLDQWSGTQSRAEITRLRAAHGFEGYVLSSLLAMGSMVPLFNLFLPILSALAFAHWDQELQREKTGSI